MLFFHWIYANLLKKRRGYKPVFFPSVTRRETCSDETGVVADRLQDERTGEKMILKLKDWPTTEDFLDTMPEMFKVSVCYASFHFSDPEQLIGFLTFASSLGNKLGVGSQRQGSSAVRFSEIWLPPKNKAFIAVHVHG